MALHRMRSQLVKFRTAQINCLRGLLTEYGEVTPQGKANFLKGIAAAMAKVSERLPALVIDTIRDQWARIVKLDEEINPAYAASGISRIMPTPELCRLGAAGRHCHSIDQDRFIVAPTF